MSSFTLMALFALFAPPLAGYVFYRRVLKPGLALVKTYDIREIPAEFGRKDLINRIKTELCGVGGEGRLEIFSQETVGALRSAHERGVKISFISGPVQICDDNRKSPLIELAKEGIINLYYSNERQQDHFWVSEKQVFSEEHHEPGALKRTAYYFRNNSFEARHFRNKFAEALKNVVPYDSRKSQFILMTQNEFDRAKSEVTCKPAESSISSLPFEFCTGSALAEALKSSTIPLLKA